MTWAGLCTLNSSYLGEELRENQAEEIVCAKVLWQRESEKYNKPKESVGAWSRENKVSLLEGEVGEGAGIYQDIPCSSCWEVLSFLKTMETVQHKAMERNHFLFWDHSGYRAEDKWDVGIPSREVEQNPKRKKGQLGLPGEEVVEMENSGWICDIFWSWK